MRLVSEKRSAASLAVEPVGQRGELVHDDLGLGQRHRRAEQLVVEHVGHRDVGSGFAKRARRVLAAGHRRHLVARVEHQAHCAASDQACGAGDEDPHGRRDITLRVYLCNAYADGDA
jgi:hypothetical protein